MKKKKQKDKPLKVAMEYEPAPDSEERLSKIYELLFSKPDRCQKNASSE